MIDESLADEVRVTLIAASLAWSFWPGGDVDNSLDASQTAAGHSRDPVPPAADFHIAARLESNTRVFNPDLLKQLLVNAGFAAYEHGEVVL